MVISISNPFEVLNTEKIDDNSNELLPSIQEMKKLKIMLSTWFEFHTERVNYQEYIKENYFKDIIKITHNNYSRHIFHESEQCAALKLLELGRILYVVKANEDIQWCDYLEWSSQTRKWTIIELKSNIEEPLFVKGHLNRLGVHTEHNIPYYLSKGKYLENIAKTIGFKEIKLYYNGNLNYNTEIRLYQLYYNSTSITNRIAL